MSKAVKATVRSQPLIAVRDVVASTQWYSELLGAENLGGGEDSDVYNRLLSNGSLVLQLHAWDTEDHPNLVHPAEARPGHGVLLWFEVDDFDAVVRRARALTPEVILEPHVNPQPRHREMWIRDPDGYVIVIASPDGEAG
ncbi:VOC family protein [Streptomyces sp. NPDC002659]|uniref:VOC family protein n=1 Tax=Streptomyces sp. NPDC002659 TaxID=3364656 RepID=UPI00368F462A